MPAPATSSRQQPQGKLTATAKNQQKLGWKAWNTGLSNYVFGREQPQAIPMEEAVLGAVLTDKFCFQQIASLLRAEMFYVEAHQSIYSACEELWTLQIPIDMLSLTERIKQKGPEAFEQIGKGYMLVELSNKVASSANMEYHARIVAERYIERETLRMCTNAIKAIYQHEEDVFTLRNQLAETMRIAPFTSLLRLRSGNDVMHEAAMMPELLQLAGSLLSQQDITLLFAQPGVGKSIFAVQIANAVSRGQMVFPEGTLVNEAGPMRTGFCDFELLDREFFKRYSDKNSENNTFQFSDTFFRIDLNPNFTDYPEGVDVEQFILSEIETRVILHQLEFLVIDNITALISQSASDPNVALRVMAALKRLRIKYGLTLLVLAHTTKQYNKSKSIEMEDMGGASAIQNFAPTIFAIGRNYNDDGELYIKQVKGRNGLVFNKDNIIKAEITKRDGNFLCFDYRGQDREDNMLTALMEMDTQDHLIAAAIEHQNRTGDGARNTAKAIGWTQSHVTLTNRMKQYRQKEGVQYEVQPAAPMPRNEPPPNSPF